MNENETLAEISGLAYGGDCIGTVSEEGSPNKGKKIFLSGVIPGESVKALIVKEEKNLLRGELLQIIKSSESRTGPPCKIFGICGGCDFQHIEINSQRKFKEEMVLSMLKKQAGLTPKEVILQSNYLPAYNYRNRITLHLNTDSELGFFKKNSGDVVDCEYCHISTEALNSALTNIRQYRNELSESVGAVVLEDFQGEIYAVLKLREGFQDFDIDSLPPEFSSDFPNLEVLNRDEVVFTSIKNDYPAGHFSQVNEKGNDALVQIVCDNTQGEHILDLYAGDGNFSIPLALLDKRVLAVEIDPSLIRYARDKVMEMKIQGRIEFKALSCEKFFKHNSALSTVLLDPPRSGAKNILPGLNNPSTNEILYISCSLPSFCRDVKEICGFGFSLEKLYIVDMFPQTHHVEIVGVLRRP